jgi:hypothetical protein
VQPRRYYYNLLPGVSSIQEVFTGANANYHSLQTSLEHRFSNGFNLITNYTFGHLIDDALCRGGCKMGSEAGPFPLLSANRRLDRGNSDIDLRQRRPAQSRRQSIRHAADSEQLVQHCRVRRPILIYGGERGPEHALRTTGERCGFVGVQELRDQGAHQPAVSCGVVQYFQPPEFRIPASSLGASNFGVISSTGNYLPRNIQLALKLMF